MPEHPDLDILRRVTRSVVDFIRELFQDGEPMTRIIGELDTCKDKGLVSWYNVSRDGRGVEFGVLGSDEVVRMSDTSKPLNINATPPKMPEPTPVNCIPENSDKPIPAPAHINRAVQDRKKSVNIDTPPAPEPSLHSVFGQISICHDCGTIITGNRELCRYCEDKRAGKMANDLPGVLSEAKAATKIIPDLAQCPACTASARLTSVVSNSYVVKCPTCRVSTLWCDSFAEAASVWNRRYRLDYTQYRPNPCPLCGGEAVVDVRYPGDNEKYIIVSKITCRYHGCVTVSKDGFPPHIGVIPMWEKLTQPFMKCSGSPCTCGTSEVNPRKGLSDIKCLRCSGKGCRECRGTGFMPDSE